MQVLFIVPYVPDPIRVRSFNLIRSLARRGHEITIFTLWSDSREQAALQQLKQTGHQVHALPLWRVRSVWNCVLAIPSRQPFQAVFSWHPGARSVLEDLLSTRDGRAVPDVVHVEHLRGAQYGLLCQEVLADQGWHTPVVWDSVDCISLLFQQAAAQSRSSFGRVAGQLDADRTRRYEGRHAGDFDRVLASSQADRAALLGLAEGAGKPAEVTVLTNGVDLGYFTEDKSVRREATRLVLSGKMSYHANVSMALHFVNEILPAIRLRHPTVELWIVGRDPPRQVRALAGLPGIVVTGEVPDLRPFLQAATVAVVPLVYGAGVQNKVLEAMACATPVVMSGRAASGLEVVPGTEAFVANEPGAFAAAVCSLLDSPDLCRQMGEAGRAYVQRRHDWDRLAAQLEGVYDEVIRSRA